MKSTGVPLPIRSRWRIHLPWAASLLLHSFLLLALLTWLTRPAAGTTEKAVQTVGLAVAPTLPDRNRFATAEVESNDPIDDESETAVSSAAAAAPPVPMPMDMDDLLASMSNPLGSRSDVTGTGSVVTGTAQFGDGRSIDDLQDSAMVPGRVKSGHGSGRTTTEVFGVSGTGSAFVYVFDRSESMQGAALRRAKSELIESLKTLSERQQFQIIFYNHDARSFSAGGRPSGLVLGEPTTIDAACRYVRGVTASGSTDHERALKLAIRLAPDVIFFLTDAKIQTMSDDLIDDLTRRAEDAGSVIAGIQFGTGPGPADPFVRRLTQRNQGGYQYLDVTQF